MSKFLDLCLDISPAADVKLTIDAIKAVLGKTDCHEADAALRALIPDPAIFKFETGTGFEVRPVVQPDGQSVVFDFNYMYTTDLLEPVRADEKHIGRVKRHFINTEVQLGEYEWREISRYEVALKLARTSRGVPLLEDVPVAGVLFRPLPQAKKSLQQNLIIGQAVIYPTIDELMGLKSPLLAEAPVGHQASEERHKLQATKILLENALNDRVGNEVLKALNGVDDKVNPEGRPCATPSKESEALSELEESEPVTEGLSPARDADV